ncbi:DUF3226 domain-containing protein [Roseivirga seohaensis]|uniref:DUF3226 domain-containing protein n=1 Tax=Roseivirga seohaensis TaxID=1914963 RepID=UPI003BA9F69F
MSGFKIVIEGETDFKFLKDFIEHRFSTTNIDREDFLITGTNNLKPERSRILSANERGESVLVIFDSDKNLGVAKERVEKQALKFDLKLAGQFYFPNNESSGNLETLLRQIINPARSGVLECIDHYGKCIGQHHINELRSFDEKAKVFIYVDSFTVGGKGKPDQVDYKEKLLWNLDAEYLQPLYEFLKPHFE